MCSSHGVDLLLTLAAHHIYPHCQLQLHYNVSPASPRRVTRCFGNSLYLFLHIHFLRIIEVTNVKMNLLLLKEPKEDDSGPDPYIKVNI